MSKASKYNPLIHHRRSIRLKGYDYSQAGSYFITMCCQDMKCRFGKIVNHQMQLNEYGLIAHEQWEQLGQRFSNCRIDEFIIMPNHMHGIISLIEPVGSGFTPDLKNDCYLEDDKHLENEEHSKDDERFEDFEHDFFEEQNCSRAGVNPARTDDLNFKHDFFEKQNCTRAGVNPARTNDVENLENYLFDDNNCRRAGVNPATTGENTNNSKEHSSISDIIGAYKSLTANLFLKIFKSNNERMGKFWQRDYYECIIRDERAFINIAAYIKNNPAKWPANKFNS